jgi:hypothetical protein
MEKLRIKNSERVFVKELLSALMILHVPQDEKGDFSMKTIYFSRKRLIVETKKKILRFSLNAIFESRLIQKEIKAQRLQHLLNFFSQEYVQNFQQNSSSLRQFPVRLESVNPKQDQWNPWNGQTLLLPLGTILHDVFQNAEETFY